MKRAQVLAPVLLFVLLAAAGTVWLVHVARGGGPATAPPPLVEAGDAPAASAAPEVGAATVATTESTTPASAAATGKAEATPAGPRITVPSSRHEPAAASPAGPGAPPVPLRAIRVGGVTLDDTSPRTVCYLVRNLDSPVTVRITALAASNPDVVIDPKRCAGVAAQGDGDWIPTFVCRAGVALLPHGDGCYTGIEPKTLSTSDEPEPLHSSFSVTLRARCTSAAGLPCQDSGSPAPTVSRPVDVTWDQPFDDSILCVNNPPRDNPFC